MQCDKYMCNIPLVVSYWTLVQDEVYAYDLSVDYWEMGQQMQWNVLRNGQHSECSLVTVPFFEDDLIQMTSMEFNTLL